MQITVSDTSAFKNDGNGYYIRQGAPKLTFIDEFTTAKADKTLTGTATNAVNPSWINNNQNISVALGNNGKLNIELLSTLTVSKTVEVPAGFDKADLNDPSFSFKIHVEGATGGYKADVMENGVSVLNEPFTITFDENGDATHSIKDGETLYIYGLVAGAEYTVTEDTSTYFETTKTGDTGTLAAGVTAAASFTNTYKVTTPGTVTGATSLKGEKVLTPRPWQDGDSFSFTIVNTKKPEAVETAPMPAETTVTVDNTVAQGADGTPVEFSFDDIKFNVPGTYKYTISEAIPAAGAAERVPGVTYSLAQYEVTVEVVDDGQGVLTATPSMVQTQLDNGDNPEPAAAATVAKFTNTYDATAQGFGPRGTKAYADNSGANPLTAGMFHFQITAKNGAPLPDGAQNGKLVVQNNADGSIAFEQVEFTAAMVGDTYEYEIVEVVDVDGQWVPVAGAITPNADGAYVQDGMTYDASVQTLTLTVSSNADGTIAVTPTYSNGQEGFVFTNSYTPSGLELTEDGNSSIAGTKTLTGRDWKDGESFGFTLTLTSNNADGITEGLDQDGTATATVVGGTAGQPSSFFFPDMTIAKPGIYTFSVAETSHNGNVLPADGTEGMYYDHASYTVTIDVKDVDGKLEGTPVYTRAGATTASAAFTNVYDADDVTIGGKDGQAGITVSKSLEGREWEAKDSFQFTLAAVDGAPMPESDTVTISSSTPGHTAAFGAITYTKDMLAGAMTKDFVYTVTEANAGKEIDGVSYAADPVTVTVTVTDPGNGKLEATVDYGKSTSAAFTNTYNADPTDDEVPANFEFTKVFKNHDWTEDYSFQFKLTAVDGAPMPKADEAAGVTIAEDGTALKTVSGPQESGEAPFDFGAITYEAAGTYKYTVSEVEGTNPGVTYSKQVAEVTVTVTDQVEGVSTGKLVASAEVSNGTFVNDYKTGSVVYDDAAGLQIVKKMTGRAIAAGDFEFTMTGNDDASVARLNGGKPMSFSTSGAALNGNVATETIDALTRLKFTQTDAGKTYTYTVAETNGGKTIDGVTYDGTTYEVAFKVTDGGEGTLSVETLVDGVSQSVAQAGIATNALPVQLVFDNSYTADPVIVGGGEDADVTFVGTKELANRPLENGEFTFNVTDAKGNLVMSGTNTADGTIVFGNVTYDVEKLNNDVAAGIATRTAGEGKAATYTYQYTVAEDQSGFETAGVTGVVTSVDVTVTVTDNGEGKLSAGVAYPEGGMVLENIYGNGENGEFVSSLNGSKVLDVKSGDNAPSIEGKYTFTVTVPEGAPAPERTTAVNDASGNVDFGQILFTMENVFGDTGDEVEAPAEDAEGTRGR